MRFEDVIGQSHVTTTLRNAIRSERVSHSYIFSGPRGVGKTTTARIFAKAINCLHPEADNNPDNACELCREITEGRSVNVFEIDGASNRSIDDVRNLRDAVRYGPARGKYKIYIIDEAHMLTREAWNALLKTLEEPPGYIMFIFATTEVQKIPATIVSRCQRFDFRRNTIEEIAGRLRFIAEAEGIAIAGDALLHIAKHADGSMRDGQSIFDQIVAFGGKEIDAKLVEQALNIVNQDLFFRFTDLMRAKDSKGVLSLVDEIVSGGVDLREFLQGLIEHFRNFLVTLLTDATKLIETTEHHKKRYADESGNFGETMLLRWITLANETDAALRYSRHPRYRLEVCLLLMLKLDDAAEIGQLLEKLEEIKEKLQAQPAPTASQPSLFSNGSTVSRTNVRGSVKATPPTLRPGQAVTPIQLSPINSIPPQNITEPKPPLYDASRTTSTLPPEENGNPVRLVPIEDVRMKWQAFIDEARKGKIALATILGESSIIELRGDRLRLACPNEFSLDVLRRHKDFITDLTLQVYGCRLRLEGIVGTGGATITLEEAPKTGTPEQEADQRQHPIIQALMREVGARQVEP